MSDNKKIDTAALAVSILALAVSFLAWYESHKQANISAGQIKSYVQVTEAKLVQPITETRMPQLQLKLKNLGQTAAVNVYGEMDLSESGPDLKGEGEGNSATGIHFGSMGPGLERTVYLKSNRIERGEWPPTPMLRGGSQVYFYGTVWYIDDTTREKRKDDWCYQLPLKTEDDSKKVDLIPCGILTYKSKPDYWPSKFIER